MVNQRGFSLLEIIIAMAIMMLVVGGAVLADAGNRYWIIDSQTNGQGLSKVQAILQEIKTLAQQNFYNIVSKPSQKAVDVTCAGGGLCYFLQTQIEDVSPCFKYATAAASWQVPGYSSMQTSLSTVLLNANEAVALGGDCVINPLLGDWGDVNITATRPLGVGNPLDIDSVGDVTYAVGSQIPYLQIYQNGVAQPFENGFIGGNIYNAIDVARDAATGRMYAYLAANASEDQLHIVDVTDAANPVLAANISLGGVPATSPEAAARHVVYYHNKIYITTRYNNSAVGTPTELPELHVIDVADPTAPSEMGSVLTGTTINAMVVRGHFLYAATTYASKELQVFDVANANNMHLVASCDLPGNYAGSALALSGNTLYLGRDTVPSGGINLYAFNAADPLSASFCTPIAQSSIKTDGFSRHTLSLEVFGQYLVVGTTNTTNVHGQVQIRKADPTVNLALVDVIDAPTLVSGIDFDGSRIYVLHGGVNPAIVEISPL